MHIRPANYHDARAISALISNVRHFFTTDPGGAGAEEFLKTITPASIGSYIEAENFNYFVATINDELAGVVALRDNKHLYHLFVAPQFQRKKIAEQLWLLVKTFAIESGNQNEFTVNSSPFAVPVYEKFGFQPTGPQVEMHGIAFIPMKLTS